MSDNKKDIFDDLYTSEVPFGRFSGQIHIETYSNRRLIADGHFSVAEYTDTFIRLKLKKGFLQIIGTDLCINSVNTEGISIIGEILNIEFSM